MAFLFNFSLSGIAVVVSDIKILIRKPGTQEVRGANRTGIELAIGFTLGFMVSRFRSGSYFPALLIH
jgi:hypothetical protein